jgi:transcriptional regulator with XRE-family HTH domain
MTGPELKSKRSAAGISGVVLSRKVGISRSQLSNIERSYITPSHEEVARIDAALDDLIRAKAVIQHAARSAGWPLGEVR